MGVNQKEDLKKDLKETNTTRRERQGEKTMKHFTAEELYEIAMDEYRRAGRHVNEAEKMGLTQWAYWSAERDDFHTEEEARAELRAFPEEDMGDLQDCQHANTGETTMPRTHKTWSPKRMVTFHTLSGRKVRSTVPEEWTGPAYLEDSVQLETGVYVQNAKRGKKYGYARLYDLHVRNGSHECAGYEHVAYLLSNPWDAERFARVEALAGK